MERESRDRFRKPVAIPIHALPIPIKQNRARSKFHGFFFLRFALSCTRSRKLASGEVIESELESGAFTYELDTT